MGASRNQTIESSAGGRAAALPDAANDSVGLESRLHSYCLHRLERLVRTPRYTVKRLLIDGQPIVLGRTFAVDASGEPIY